ARVGRDPLELVQDRALRVGVAGGRLEPVHHRRASRERQRAEGERAAHQNLPPSTRPPAAGWANGVGPSAVCSGGPLEGLPQSVTNKSTTEATPKTAAAPRKMSAKSAASSIAAICARVTWKRSRSFPDERRAWRLPCSLSAAAPNAIPMPAEIAVRA